jgi:hypothetical protein
LAVCYGVSESNISTIVLGQSWMHLGEHRANTNE